MDHGPKKPREMIRNDVVLKSLRRANVAADYWISGNFFAKNDLITDFRSNHAKFRHDGEVCSFAGWRFFRQCNWFIRKLVWQFLFMIK